MNPAYVSRIFIGIAACIFLTFCGTPTFTPEPRPTEILTPSEGGSRPTAEVKCPVNSLSSRQPSALRLSISIPSAYASSPIPWDAKLCFLDKPLVNTPARLLFRFKSLYTIENAKAVFILPENIELIGGDSDWTGRVSSLHEYDLTITIKVIRTGYDQIAVKVIDPDERIAYSADVVVMPDGVALGDSCYAINKWFASLYTCEDYRARHPSMTPLISPTARSELFISKTPVRDEPFSVTYRVTPTRDLLTTPNTFPRLIFVFPSPGLELMSFDTPSGGRVDTHEPFKIKWYGDIHKDQTIEIRGTFRIVADGWGIFYAWLFALDKEPRNNTEDIRMIRMYMDRYGGQFREVK